MFTYLLEREFVFVHPYNRIGGWVGGGGWGGWGGGVDTLRQTARYCINAS